MTRLASAGARDLLTAAELRFALAHARLDHGADDVSLADIVERMNYLRGIVAAGVCRAMPAIAEPTALGAHPALQGTLARQDEALWAELGLDGPVSSASLADGLVVRIGMRENTADLGLLSEAELLPFVRRADAR